MGGTGRGLSLAWQLPLGLGGARVSPQGLSELGPQGSRLLRPGGAHAAALLIRNAGVSGADEADEQLGGGFFLGGP